MLPISSSGHTTVIPWLLGSEYPELEPELRKALEVTLHAGALLALLIAPRQGRLDRCGVVFILVGTVPAGVVGLLLETGIEDRLGTPPAIAAGLLVGGLALAAADRRPQARHAEEAGITDALWLGLAQATALIPGISRSGATLAMARCRRFHRGDAARLSRRLALPVITGATLLKAWRVRERPELAEHAAELGAGALASFLSTRLAARLDDARTERPLLLYAGYRVALAALVLSRSGRAPRGPVLGHGAHDQGHAAPA